GRCQGLGGGGRADVPRSNLPGSVSARRRLCRQDSARGEAGQSPGRAADQIRSRHQSDHRQGTRPCDPGDILGARRRGDRVKRRTFITLVGGAAAWPLAERAQQPALPLIGYLSGDSSDSLTAYPAVFRRSLAEAGYVDGQNVEIEYRWAGGQPDRLPALATELVSRKVTVLYAVSNAAAYAAKAA